LPALADEREASPPMAGKIGSGRKALKHYDFLSSLTFVKKIGSPRNLPQQPLLRWLLGYKPLQPAVVHNRKSHYHVYIMPLLKKLSVKTINAALIFLIVAIFLVVFFVCYRSLLQIDTDEFWVIHSYQVSTKLDSLISDLENIETSQRGYVITGQASFLGPYNTYLPDIDKQFQALQDLTADNAVQQQYLSTMKPLLAAKIAWVQGDISLRTNEGFGAAQAEVATDQGKALMDSIRAIVANMQTEESGLLQTRREDLAQVNSATESIIIWGSIIAFLFYILVNYIIERFVIGEIVQKPLLEEALKANKEMEAFSYSVSHDLRAPLRAIDGFTQILVEDYGGKLDDEGKRVAGIIRASTVQMGKLIDDLLSFSRLGRAEVKKVPVTMSALADETYKEVRKASPERNIEFAMGALPDVRGDVDMIRQVWTNLFTNAIKFTGKKEKAKIEVGSISGDDSITYYVKDNGAGFDMQYIGKLFGVFQRLHSTEEFEGTGIGLANVKRIVERHGGKVWAEGKVGEGATFYFALPKK
jgi:signal transduction histidine kinase